MQRGQPVLLPWQQLPVGFQLSKAPVGSLPTSQAEGSQVAAGPLCPWVAS